ncbi:hypothetical protein [Methylobacterium sp. sgz302541]|uniref:hypothetical protein n=1 Tax=unclassified Methylobacterium TaxID=2615210 RepID=UPI003D34E5EC
MTRIIPTGRAPSMSLADFNAKAKRISASTGEVEKGSVRRPPANRWRKDVPSAETSAPATARAAVEAE